MKRSYVLVILTSVLIFLNGCGGGRPTGSGGVGRAVVTIKWPEQTRLIPAATKSIKITISKGQRECASRIVLRPAEGTTSTATFDVLPTGDLTVTACAYGDEEGSGTALATGSAPVTIAGGQEAVVKLTMGSTIVKMSLHGAGIVDIGTDPPHLQVYAQDENGYQVITTPSSLEWTSSDPSVLSVDADGQIRALALGSATITVKDRESGISASGLIYATRLIPGGSKRLAINTVTNKIYSTVSYPGSGVTQYDGVSFSYTFFQGAAGQIVRGITVDESRNRLCAVCEQTQTSGPGDGLLKVYNCSNTALLGEVALPAVPGSVAVDEAANRIYVGCGTGADSRIAVVNGSDYTVAATVTLALPDGSSPALVAVVPWTGKVFVIASSDQKYNRYPGQLYTLDTTSYTAAAVDGLEVGLGAALDEANNVLYLMDLGNLLTLDGNGKVTATTPVDLYNCPYELALDRTLNRLYFCSGYGLYWYDLVHGGARFFVSENPDDIKIDNRNGRIYLALGNTPGGIRVMSAGR